MCRRRKAERTWLRSGLPSDHDTFKEEKKNFNQCLYQFKCTYFNEKLKNCGNNYKKLFRAIKSIIQNKASSKLPDHDCHVELAERFSLFFLSKVSSIRESLSTQMSKVTEPESCASSSWDNFTMVSDSAVRDYMYDHNLHEPLQSAYKRFHGTETSFD